MGRKSSDYECDSTADCDPDRKCEGGYCVERANVTADASLCPAVCDGSCDPAAKTCQATCDQAGECNSFSCPTGYACTIRCTAANACHDITGPATAATLAPECSTCP